jgi:hypothetical protein
MLWVAAVAAFGFLWITWEISMIKFGEMNLKWLVLASFALLLDLANGSASNTVSEFQPASQLGIAGPDD